MNDEQLLGKVGSWLKDTEAAHVDTERITERAMSQVPQVRQRGRWWPLPVLDRGYQGAPASGSTVVSALKFVTAGLIVGLFGGFLLAGALTTRPVDEVPAALPDPPSPMTTDELLSIAQTVEVEPGVVQVIDDGVRELVSADSIGLVSGRDGGIWLLKEDGFARLGTGGTHEWLSGEVGSASDFEVAPDGTVWTLSAVEDDLATARSFDGEAWTSHQSTADTRTLEIAPDGTTWGVWQEPGSETVSIGYLDGDDRELVGQWPESELYDGDLFLPETGEAWVIGAQEYRVGKPRLYRLVNGTLEQEYEDTLVAADVGPDGTVWLVSINELIRLDGTVTEKWALPDAMTVAWADTPGWTFVPGDEFRVAADGRAWFALRATSGPPMSEEYCAGVAGFDGTTWLGPYLPDLCVESVELAADGSVWLLARAAEGGDGLVDLFVVNPEAAS